MCVLCLNIWLLNTRTVVLDSSILELNICYCLLLHWWMVCNLRQTYSISDPTAPTVSKRNTFLPIEVKVYVRPLNKTENLIVFFILFFKAS